MPLRPNFNPMRLDESGWGVIFARGSEVVQLRQSLAPLIEWRKRQSGYYFRELEAGPDETANAFLARYGLRPGAVDPERVPYYLLIVAPPSEISYDFQADLSVDYAVGRLWFDESEGFNSYASHQVEYEQREPPSSRQTVFFAPANPDDWATKMIAQTFMQPLYERSLKEFPRWKAGWVPPEAATKGQLSQIIGQETPQIRLLVTAGQGVAFPLGDPRQRLYQGGIVCQDWPGPARMQEIGRDFYFAAEDVAEDADLSGLITFHFSDYSLGTPTHSTAQAALFEEAPPLAESPFVARLPQRLLAHPRGVQAAVGLADRLWLTSLPDLRVPSQNTVAVVESCLRRLLQGFPLGYALEYFSTRYAELSSSLAILTEEAQFGKKVDTQELVSTWASMSTARSLVLLGDPAVRLDRVDERVRKMAY